MSDFEEEIVKDKAFIKHLDNHFGHHVYGFQPVIFCSDDKPKSKEGPIYMRRESAVNWIDKNFEK